MEAKTNYKRVGLTVVILAVALLICALWLSIGFEKRKYNFYLVYMHDAVSGLSDESPVKFNGVQVGSVYNIALSRVNPQNVELLLKIVDGTPITTSTSATIVSQGITGITFVGLTAASADLTPLKKKPGEPYPVIPSRPSLYNQFDKILKDISQNVNELSMRLKKIISDKNAKNIQESLANIKSFTRVLRVHDKEIGNSIVNVDIVLKNMAAASKLFTPLIYKISNQTMPPIIQLINQLNNIAANIEKVSVDLRQNPAVLIRGTAPPLPGPGEK